MLGMAIGAKVVHPVTGEELPVYIANYVLGSYATGCVMGVPAHDARDHRFAMLHGLPVRQVLSIPAESELPHPGDGSSTLINSGKYDGLRASEAFDTIVADGERNGWGKHKTTYNVHDWLVSRQRYWGTPIPIIHCPSCGAVPVPEEDLPVELPVEGVTFKGKGSPLAEAKDWLNCTCPKYDFHFCRRLRANILGL